MERWSPSVINMYGMREQRQKN